MNLVLGTYIKLAINIMLEWDFQSQFETRADERFFNSFKPNGLNWSFNRRVLSQLRLAAIPFLSRI